MTERSLPPVLALFLAAACSMAPTLGKRASSSLQDGVYEGSYSSFPNSAKVEVTVAEQRIAKVEIIEHFASSRGKRAEDAIPKRIVEEQSTEVDAVSGATNSSRVIMNAAQDALKKAATGN